MYLMGKELWMIREIDRRTSGIGAVLMVEAGVACVFWGLALT